MSILKRAAELLDQESKAMECPERKRLGDAAVRLLDALVGSIPFDWRYNATYWALNVVDVCTEIGVSIGWMRAFAKCSAEKSAQFHVSYYADNAATRISSCRDKLALLAWSYFCPFNPENRQEVLSFDEVRKRLTRPLRYALKLQGHEAFLDELNKLVGQEFQEAIAYRNSKIHRMEPQVMLREPKGSDHPSYLLAADTEGKIRDLDEKLTDLYPTEPLRSIVRENCVIDGILFDHLVPGRLLWHFGDFDQCAYVLDAIV